MQTPWCLAKQHKKWNIKWSGPLALEYWFNCGIGFIKSSNNHHALCRSHHACQLVRRLAVTAIKRRHGCICLCGQVPGPLAAALRSANQLEIHAACLHQLRVGAALHHPACCHDDNGVGAAHRGQAVGDDERGDALPSSLKLLSDPLLRLHVLITGRGRG